MNQKYAPFIFASIMALAMGFFMSLFLTWINTGFHEGFLLRWMKAFGVGICVAFPISLIIAPIAQRLVILIIKDNDNSRHSDV